MILAWTDHLKESSAKGWKLGEREVAELTGDNEVEVGHSG